MNKLKIQLNSNQKVFKKASEAELRNLIYLLDLDPSLLPPNLFINQGYYTLDLYDSLQLDDVGPTKFPFLLTSTIFKWHHHKKKYFTPGLYKYFEPYPIDKCISLEYYNYNLIILEKIINCISNNLHYEYKNELSNIHSNLKTRGKILQNRYHKSEFSLLHGDLHIGNIVKSKSSYYLIDYEFLRYGPPELEIMNLIVSILIWLYLKKTAKHVLQSLTNSIYTCALESKIYKKDIIDYMFLLAILMYCFKYIIKNDSSSIEWLTTVLYPQTIGIIDKIP